MISSSNQLQLSFDIRNFIDILTPAKEKGKYICPVCKGHNLSINQSNGAYQCYNGCEHKDIRDTIAPFNNNQATRTVVSKSSKPRETGITSIPLPDKIVFSEYIFGVNPRTSENKSSDGITIIRYFCSENQSVRRDIRPDGTKDCSKGSQIKDELGYWHTVKNDKANGIVASDIIRCFPPFGFDSYMDENDECTNKDIVTAALSLEGESNVITAAKYEIPAFSFNGQCWQDDDYACNHLDKLKATYPNLAVIVHIEDNDDAGKKRTKALARQTHKVGLAVLILKPSDVIPNAEIGDDIKEVIEYWGAERLNIPNELKRWIDETVAKEQEATDFIALAPTPPKLSAITPVAIADDLAEIMRDKILFDSNLNQWYAYATKYPGVWSKVSEYQINALVKGEIQSRFPTAKYDTNFFLEQVVKTLRLNLLCLDFEDTNNPNEMPFRNGILDIVSMQLRSHCPSNRLLWSLPREYKPDDNQWDKTRAFLMESVEGNKEAFDILSCFAAAVIRNKYKLQKYEHIIGLPGSGKGTYSNLLIKFIGSENVAICEMDTFNSNQFAPSIVHGKRLAIFPDQQEYHGKIGNFLNLTGNEPLRYEKKGKDATHFLPTCLTLVTSNDPTFKGKNLNAVQRRQVLVRMDNQVLIPNPNLLDELTEELSGWTNYLLSIPDSQISLVLSGKSEQSKLLAWDTYTQSSILAAWVNEHLIHSPGSKVQVGIKEEDSTIERCNTLFSSYLAYCKACNAPNTFTKDNFSKELDTMFKVHLRWVDVAKKREAMGQMFLNVKLRKSEDIKVPVISDLIGVNVVHVDHGSSECRPNVDLHVDLEPLPSKAYVDHVDLSMGFPLLDGTEEKKRTLTPTSTPVKSQTLDISVADRQPEVGDTVEVISNDVHGVAKGTRCAVAVVCAGYGVKLSIPNVGTGKGKPDCVTTEPIQFKNVRVVIVR